jgi:hypothetical protein
MDTEQDKSENQIETKQRTNRDWNTAVIADAIQNLAAEGYKKAEIGHLLGISSGHMREVILHNPELEEKLLAGKAQATRAVVRTALRVAIGGTEYEEITIKETAKGIEKTIVKKTSPPNPTMIIFWLTNRDNANWKHIREILKTTKLDITNEKPEADKIAGLFGEVSRDDSYRPGSECSVPPKTTRVSVKKRIRETDVSGDVCGKTVDNIQNDAMDVSAEEGTEHS